VDYIFQIKYDPEILEDYQHNNWNIYSWKIINKVGYSYYKSK